MPQTVYRFDDRLQWQTSCRSKTQKTMLELYTFMKDNRAMLKANESKRSACGLLLGTAFSLWRATFLADTSREWKEVREHAEQFLERVLRDNAINYAQDRENRAWTVGFYLNNARFRLCHIHERFPEYKEIKALQKISHYCKSGIGDESTKYLWDLMYEALCAAFLVLKRK